MFFARHIWKTGTGLRWWAGLLVLSLSLVAQPAMALGETYTWQGTDETGLTATGGNYGTGSAAFTKSGGSNGGAVFTSNASYDCNGQSTTGTLTITIDATNYQKTLPTGATLSGADSACGFTSDITVDQPNVNVDTGAPSTGSTQQAPCDQGGFTWLLCPVIDNVSGAISNLAKDVLQPMLEVKPITATNTPQLYQTWSHLRDLTQVLFTLIFFILIIATVMQRDIRFFDQYTLKKVLPRLVIAAVLVQFSFLISSLIVDLGNVLGSGIGGLLTNLTDPSKGPASFSNLLGNLAVGSVAAVTGLGALAVLASWTVAVPILVSLFLSLLAVFLTLGARYLILSILIALSPLAFLAWVLPNTEKHFYEWLKLMLRLVLMYPMVVGIISLAGIVNEILPFSTTTAPSGGAAVAAALIKPIIVIAAFAAVPISFRLAGRAIHRVQGLFNGAAQRGKGALKGSDMWQRGQDERQKRKNALMENVLGSKPITSLRGKGKAGRAVAGMMGSGAALALMRAPANREALDRSRSAMLTKARKQIEELREAENPYSVKKALTAYTGTREERAKARAELATEAPNLLRYAGTPTGREAMARILADKGFLDKSDLHRFITASPTRNPLSVNSKLSNEYIAVRDDLQGKRKDLPALAVTMRARQEGYTVKDATDRPVMLHDAATGRPAPRTMVREIGDLDVNKVADTIRKMTENEFANRMTADSLEVLGDRSNSSPRLRRASEDFALSVLMGADAGMMGNVMKVGTRNALSPKKKIMLVQGMQQHRQLAVDNAQLRPKYDAIVQHVDQDEYLATEMAKMAGAADYMVAGMNQEERAEVARRWWVDGENYDASKIYANLARERQQAAYFAKRDQANQQKGREDAWQQAYDKAHPAPGGGPGGPGPGAPGGTPNPGNP